MMRVEGARELCQEESPSVGSMARPDLVEHGAMLGPQRNRRCSTFSAWLDLRVATTMARRLH